jgi:hypothetical protein
MCFQLYTKSYELFKKHTTSPSPNTTQGRLTLWIAYRIAQTYYDSGKFDMAVRFVVDSTDELPSSMSSSSSFFERIAKTYHREKWYSMLRPLLSTWYACAQQLGDVELSVKLLVEQLGQGHLQFLTTFLSLMELLDLPNTEDSNSIEEDLLAVLMVYFIYHGNFSVNIAVQSTVPSSDVLSVDLSESPICTLDRHPYSTLCSCLIFFSQFKYCLLGSRSESWRNRRISTVPCCTNKPFDVISTVFITGRVLYTSKLARCREALRCNRFTFAVPDSRFRTYNSIGSARYHD